MLQQQSSYRQIMKATSIFGGVQVFNIIIQIVRSKFVAVLLGPSGMGIMGLLASTTDIISSMTNFGLGTSAVKDIAAVFGTDNEKRIGIVITVVRRLVWITGMIGFLAVGILSPWLSQLTFGNKNYTLAFIWISVTLLFNQLSSGQLVVLQGLRKLNYLAKANLSGSFTGLFITVPIYYFWGLDGIVPGIISTSVISLLMSWYFSAKVKVERAVLSRSQTFAEGKNMLKMGFLISLNGMLVIGASYIIRIFISRTGGVDQVGLYNAGFVIINTYVSLIFNAMATDYYPRLSAVSADNRLCKQTINQQAEIALLILAPIMIVFLIFINWIIILLYSNRFVEVNEMIQWAALGMFFKTIGWSVGFVFLAKGTTKLFFWNELIATIYILSFNLIGYYFWGLTGLGLSFAVAYLIYTIQVFVVSKIKFGFSFDRSIITIFSIQFGLAVAGFLTVKLMNQNLTYLAGVILIFISGWFSLRQLNKRLGLLNLLNQYMQKSRNS
jgi:O-antigen/teichoic acid export membrane protein